jgi:hypothetical protein
MKQQIIELKKRLLLVELPEGINGEDVSINHNQDDYEQLEFQYPTHEFRGMQCYDNILLPKGYSYKSIGKLTDITESQFTKLVSGVIEYGKQENHPIWTAKKGFFSKLTEDKIYFKNPLGEFPTKQNTGLEYGMEYISKVQRWEEAESKVWDINRCWIFEIL